VIVPLFPSHFSALGMLLADERHDFIRTFYVDLARADFKNLVRICEEMEQEAKSGLRHAKGAQTKIHLDIRYVGQEFFLSVPVTLAQLKKGDRTAIRKAFDKLYEHRYAHHSPDEPVELVNVRLAMIGKRPRLKFPAAEGEGRPKPVRTRKVFFSDPRKAVAAPVYARKTLGAGARIVGPALIEEHGTTTVLFEGDVCKVAPSGELIIQVRGAA
jgi:N-methylhydantoinase A